MIRLSIDDGCASDLRVAELAKKYNIETIFYWPIEWVEVAYIKGYMPLSMEHAKQLASEFEVGSHGITHRRLTRIPVKEAEWEISESKNLINELFGQVPEKFCPSRGYTTPHLTNYAMKHYKEQRLTRGEGLVHIHPKSGANNNKPWRKRINAGTKEVWGHSFELDRYNLWDELEEFLSENSSA